MRSSPTIEVLISSGLVRRMTGGSPVPRDDATPSPGLPFSSLLASGITHEWFGTADTDSKGRWHPPLTLIVESLAEALRSGSADSRPGLVVWVGRSCWPRCPGWWLSRSLFIDPPDAAARLWATDMALRCEGVAAVVGDASRFDMAATRRLQLAAEAGKSAVGLLVRPPWERKELSAAATRWAVNAEPSGSRAARWRVELLRCKRVGAQEMTRDERGCWVVDLSTDLTRENDRGPRAERASAGVAGRAGTQETGPKRKGEDRRVA